MFSAAVPGQGGEHHINEQPLEYWRRKFAQRGYLACDVLRPLLRSNTQVEPWYRYNILIYASAAVAATLTIPARRCWRARNITSHSQRGDMRARQFKGHEPH
jgi:hypothetical protein